MSLTVIELENMEFQAFHGCYELERQVGNRFQVSVRIEAELGEAADSDRIKRASNHLDVFETVREQMDIPSHILEHVRRKDHGWRPSGFRKASGFGSRFRKSHSSGRENRESLGNSRKTKGGERVLITS